VNLCKRQVSSESFDDLFGSLAHFSPEGDPADGDAGSGDTGASAAQAGLAPDEGPISVSVAILLARL
jgi:hypothetical protein